ncbi:protein kinase [Streptomyces sp. ISL-99]|uniref:caspase, EACC1-associated type n=1 Tax=Streptomyces sp. ISL-99 TaxID=2819193 RepID=UPI001BEC6213|nr:protein kinase [Streptomyces sp. ISL-99]MBT2530142.1 protein kinase [Streptomyces sp. ISL-99]
MTPNSLPDPARSRVVLIGFAQYSHAPDLPAISNNLDSLRDFFLSEEGWGMAAEHCHVIEDATTADDLIAPLNRAAAEARDTLFVYYAGHGILDEALEFFLSMPGSRLHEPWTGVSYRWIRQAITRSRAKRRVAVLDSCFSGKVHAAMGGPSQAVKAQTAAGGTVVLTSARDDRVALAPEGDRYTAFTGELLTVLRRGIDGGSRLLTVDHVYEQVKFALALKGRPRPDRTGSDTCGKTVLAVNPAFTADASDPTPRTPGVSARERLHALADRLGATDAPTGGHGPLSAPPTAANPREKTQQRGSAASAGPAVQAPRIRRPLPIIANGRYRFTAAVGMGGMGEVFLAQDTVLGREVIVKRLHGHQSGSDHLLYEARAAAALNHPSIATVHDVVTDAAGDFIVMEHVRGWPLDQVPSLTRPTVPESVAALHDILDGLEHSHAAGIIHCDIKPHNLILTASGRVKILDFGISSLNESAHREGQIAGTVLYMPPECWAGAAPHATRDIYSAGAVLYQLITGRGVHQGHAFPSSPPPPPARPRELVPGLDAGIEAVMQKALAPKPADRYTSAAHMRSALGRYL